MNGPVDVHGILERAGANPDAPEGSQAWALAQVDAAVAELVEADRFYADERNYSSTSVMERGAAIEEDGGNKARAALAHVGAK